MHTPSAYTLTNTTRPSRIKRKIRGAARALKRARATAVELVFSPRSNNTMQTTVTETHRTGPHRIQWDGRAHPAVRRVDAVSAGRAASSTRQEHTMQFEVSPGSRACNPARSYTSQYTSTRACVLTCARHTLVHAYTLCTLKHTEKHTCLH